VFNFKGRAMRYLLTGATGNVGRRVWAQLRARGIEPRVLARDPQRMCEGADVVPGDLIDERSLRAACSGIDVLFLLNSGPDLAARDALAARVAREQGVRRIVKLSALGARASGCATAVARWHAEGEQAIGDSGLEATFVQPVGFMTNVLAWAPSIRRAGVVRASTGDGRIAMIHPDDIARVVVEALLDERGLGALRITGPAALSYAEMTEQLGAAVGRRLRFESISDREAGEELSRQGLPPALVTALIELWSEVREGLVSLVTEDVQRVTGRSPIPFAAFAASAADAFR
jgi:uncharacterized protein YbjT (DUF2867 family)